MGKVISMSNYLKKRGNLEKIEYYVCLMIKHNIKYDMLCNKKIVLFRKIRLKKLKALITADKQEIEIYTRLYHGNISSFEEGLITSTVI